MNECCLSGSAGQPLAASYVNVNQYLRCLPSNACSCEVRWKSSNVLKEKSAPIFRHACFALVFFLAYSSTLNMETKWSSETSLDFHRNILLHSRKHKSCCANLESKGCLFNEIPPPSPSLATAVTWSKKRTYVVHWILGSVYFGKLAHFWNFTHLCWPL
jgi:hypothetical protein